MKVYVWSVVLIELLLIALGPSLIASDISFLAEWLHTLGGDFYVIMTLAALISIWGIFGFAVTIYKSNHGFHIYHYGLSSMIIIQFIISFIHAILLFKYRPLLLDSCLQRQPVRVFWWSLGGSQNNTMMKDINDACTAQWHGFVKQRIVTLCVYNVILLFCLYIVSSFQYRTQDGVMNVEKRASMALPKHHLTDTSDEGFVAEMYRQRQRIFDEISKKREARKSIHERTVINAPPPSVTTTHFPPTHFDPRTTSLDLERETLITSDEANPPLYQHDAKTPLLLDEKDEQELKLSPPLPYAQTGSEESFTTAETDLSKGDDENSNQSSSPAPPKTVS